VLESFLAAASARGLELYPEQEEAILELLAGRNVVLNTPTGSGKSLVAAAFHFKAALRRRAVGLPWPDQGAGQRKVPRVLPATSGRNTSA